MSSASPREIELKLEVSADGLQCLQDHPRLSALAVGPASSRQLRSVYFDTPELDLRRHRIGLRIRAKGQERIQTVKTGGSRSGGLFDRLEYEAVVTGEGPDLERIPDAALRKRLQGLIGDRPLAEIFVTEMQRTRRLLRNGSSEWTLDIDQGEVRTATASAPIREIELELHQGDAGSLFELALDLLGTVELTPGTQSKADRGYALVTGARPLPRTAGPIELEVGQSLADAFQATVGSCLGQVADNALPALEGTDPEGIHQMRVGVRRLRSALTCFREVLPERELVWLRGELRWLANALGAARDLDAFTEDLLAPICRLEPGDPALERLHAACVELRVSHQGQVRAALDSERYSRLILTLGHWLTCGGWREQRPPEAAARLVQPVEEHAAQVLRRLHRKVRRLGGDLAAAPAPQRHRLRLQLKKLRYATEFFSTLYDRKDVRRYARRVRALQDLLGHLNDVATADRITHELLLHMGDEASAEHYQAVGFVLGWAARQSAGDEARLLRRWRKFERAQPFWR